ncbi:MAG: hypothetical protein JWQ35_963 [Bacteriovoracaceae bacterium]|nr:hypothetical protein [Bacteriovoracaceae bacterium]
MKIYKIIENKDKAGLLIDRTTHYDEKDSGHLVLEKFVNGQIFECCEYINNWKDGVQKLYSKDAQHVLLEESLWSEDRLIEKKEYFATGTLKRWLKYDKGRPFFEKEFTAEGNILKDVQDKKFPQVKYRHFNSKTGHVSEECIQIDEDVTTVRRYFDSGSLEHEKVRRKNNASFDVSLREDGAITYLKASDETLRPFLLTAIPMGRWIKYKSQNEFHLMENLKDLGVVSEPKIDRDLFTGWKNDGFYEKYFENGLDTPYYKSTYPDVDKIREEFLKVGEKFHFNTYDKLGEPVLNLSKQLSAENWAGKGKYSFDNIIIEEAIEAFSRRSQKNSPPVEFKPHGKSVTSRLDGFVISEENFSHGKKDGLSWKMEDWDGVEVKTEMIFKNDVLVSKEVFKNGTKIFEKHFK